MATIKPIEARTIHQIQSGQVIVDLCSVVKELVENSLDAGATTIDVRFKNQGLDSIEVQDNGSGISKENYETLALKHYTSKLSSYSDLGTLQTFGFRGEALSSLCALSKFTVTTCLAADAPKGSKLEFETSGKLCGTNVVAAQKGTTISVEGLFRNLPVRRRELERNIKREWNKVIGVLNQYACIQTGVKFSVSQQPIKGKRIVLFSTKGNRTTRDNIVNVFGSKTLAVLIPLDLKLELEVTSAPGKRLTQQEEGSTTKEIRIQGHVSRPAHGEGRQTPDRQMFFVNARPCGLPQFAKVFNEVYKSYNASQSPFIFADIQLDTHLYDVNVSPDKRTILLHEQSRMLDNLRESLIALFESHDYAVPASQLSMPKYTPFKKPAFNRRDTETPESGKDSSVLSEDDRGQSMSADVGKRPTTDSEDDVEQFQGPPPTTSLSVSTMSIAQDAQNINLISRWAERKSDVCTDSPTVQMLRSDGGETSRSREKLVTDLTREGLGREGDKNQEDEDEGPDPSDSVVETEETPNQIENFRERLEEIRNSQTERSIDADTRSSQPTSEPPIPAISTPSRKSDIRITKVTPSRNLKRTAPEVATITIGNDTVTSVIGSPSKRLRSEDVRSSRSPQKQRAKESAPVPSFQGRLTQMFAAQSQSKSGKSADIEVATELVDFEKQSESSGEHLFVTEDEGEEEEEEEEKAQEEDNAPESEEEHHQNKVDTRDAIEEDVPEDIEEDHPSPGKSTDDEYVDEAAKEDQKELEDSASPEPEEDQPEKISEETQKRTQSFIKGSAKKKDATYPLQQTVRINEGRIRSALADHEGCLRASLSQSDSTGPTANRLDASDAEEKLSLKISKSDFEKMKIVGQFNLGFIIAVRPAERVVGGAATTTTATTDDELFIIDQHATDEKYNFERLQASTVVQSQRLVQPKTLELTALEEEIIKENLPALEANGFAVAVDDSGDRPVGSRCQLLSLPLSRETTFSLADLEELISLLADHQSSSADTTTHGNGNGDGSGKTAIFIPRPSKVRKMFAMRACRSSVMIGKPLPARHMERLVRHMGELDKPWNCPHGRPTMRHLCGLGAWDEAGWAEGDSVGFAGNGGGRRRARTNWAAYVRGDED
ncbi:ATP-binding mismatch repair protein [Diatrype stigma]|uniref:DNA mismatch repair protein PMS1 n=1 Tax=Diatrype stigma TaxID=117547 RepID=A0AAN9VAQ8_9PEZI